MVGRERDFRVEALDLGQIRDIYRTYMTADFPDNELKPLSMIEAAVARGEYRCFGAMAGGKTLAYAFLVCLSRGGRKLCLFDYLAVRRELRGSGLGSAFMKALSAGQLREFDCVLLEVDHPAFAETDAERGIRERRLRFYLRNGLVETGVEARVYGAEYRILTFPFARPRDAEDTRETYAALYRAIMPPRIYARMVAIR